MELVENIKVYFTIASCLGMKVWKYEIKTRLGFDYCSRFSLNNIFTQIKSIRIVEINRKKRIERVWRIRIPR